VPISHKSLNPFVVRRANLSPFLSSNALEKGLGHRAQQKEDRLKHTSWQQSSQLGSIRQSCHLLACLLGLLSRQIFQGPVGLLLLVHHYNFRGLLKEVSGRCRIYLEQKPRHRKMYRLDLENDSQFQAATLSLWKYTYGNLDLVWPR
jgi:hypothetical protein